MKQQLITHLLAPEDIKPIIDRTAKRIRQEGDKLYVTVAQELELLDQLNEFNFGRFLLQNQGLNGFWTHYMLTHPWLGRKTGKDEHGRPLFSLEKFLLDRAPTILATQQRFEIFLKENQQTVKNKATLACIPCGMMGELLYLNFDEVEDIRLIGIDYDQGALRDAQWLAEKKDLLQFVNLVQSDAWQITADNEYDLISSNGLTIYEPDDEKVTKLYQLFYKALKPDGKLVTSFLTYPPNAERECSWNFDNINQEDLLLQKIIFVDILQVKWQCFRTAEQVSKQLKAANFKDIQFIYDPARIFPTVIAYKR